MFGENEPTIGEVLRYIPQTDMERRLKALIMRYNAINLRYRTTVGDHMRECQHASCQLAELYGYLDALQVGTDPDDRANECREAQTQAETARLEWQQSLEHYKALLLHSNA